MKDKLGRNDLCHCGSGKKYKKCCIEQNAVNNEVADLQWVNLRKLEGSVVDEHLSPYVMNELPKDVVNQAMMDFFPEGLPEAMEDELKGLFFNNFFLPWVLFNWTDEFYDLGIKNFHNDKTISENYAIFHAAKLNSAQKRFIKVMSETYYSFYCVLDVHKEKSLIVKDILLGTTHTIKERLGTNQIKRGDLVFSRILFMDGQSIFIGMAPMIISARYHNNILDYRQWLIEENDNNELTPALLREVFSYELLDYFFEIVDHSFNQQLPNIQNTDGEPLLFSKSYFKLKLPPKEALVKLLPMTLSKSENEFLQDAEYDNNGLIIKLELPWLKKGNKKHNSWDNTVMGHVAIKNNKLTLETNSENRTKKGKKLLSKYLGDSIEFQQTLLETPKNKLENLSEIKKSNNSSEEILELPEIQEQLKGFIENHWREWFDKPIPALKNLSPREAAKTKDGRERLEALLLQYERNDLEKNNNLLKANIPYLREQLSL